MKIALCQINSTVGDIYGNTTKIISCIKKAKENNSELIVFPELSVCGYPPEDLLLQNNFVEKCELAINTIAEQSQQIAIIVGAPSLNTKKNEKPFFNSAYFLLNGKIDCIIHKTLLPDYDVFDELRYFEPNKEFKLINYKNTNIALTICEDIWHNKQKIYSVNPINKLIKLKPDLFINIAASPYHTEQKKIRSSLFSEITQKTKTPLIYVNTVGANTDLVFDGNSCIYNSTGKLSLQLKNFEEDLQLVETNNLNSTTQSINSNSEIENMYNALITGVKNYFEKNNFKKAILGLSGGIDSAVTLAIAANALGSENITAVLMPSKYSSKHSVTDAELLLQNISCKKLILPIQNSVESIESSIVPFFENKKSDVTEENIQSRIRGIFLMALSNKHGYILLNTTNKSEMAVGYGTLYGDMCGAISVLGDVYKTQVYEIANFINRHKEIIPNNIITKEPSAELKPNQKDSDSLPEYTILDKILFLYLEKFKNKEQIIAEGFEKKLVEKTICLVNTSEYKRFQAPPVIRISSKAFGKGRKMPLVAKF
jgi:NAD+ synthase (glutamine-hydrolysing)